MTRETKKLKRTIDRYIPLRMFHHNPHTNSPRLEFEYYEFRSEEVYRAWLVVSQDGRLREYLSPSEAVTLYVYLVPHWCWSGCIHDYDERFIEHTNTAWASIKGDPGSRFEQVFQSFFNRTRLGLHSWTESDALSGGDQISLTNTESHEEALQAFGNQPQAQPDGALTLYGVPFQRTREAPHQDHPPVGRGDLEETLRGFQGGSHRVLDALFTGGAGEIVDGSVEDGGFNGMPEGSGHDQMRGDQDIPCIVPPVAVSDMSGSSARGIRRVRRETAVLPRVD